MKVTTLVNGVLADSIAVNDRGLAYGDGLFETIEVVAACPRFLGLHLARLEQGCRRLNIHFDLEILKKEINSILSFANSSKAILKIIVTRAGSGRGYQADRNALSNRILLLEPLRRNYSKQQSIGVRVRVCDHRLPNNPFLAGLKHLARLDNVIARSEWNDDQVAEGLMLDSEGRLVEGTMSNVFLVEKNKVLTPRLDRCGVDGIVRRVIMETILPSLGVEVFIKDLVLNDVYQADEIFICNSLIGILPVVAIGCHGKEVGALTRDIQLALLKEN